MSEIISYKPQVHINGFDHVDIAVDVLKIKGKRFLMLNEIFYFIIFILFILLKLQFKVFNLF